MAYSYNNDPQDDLGLSGNGTGSSGIRREDVTARINLGRIPDTGGGDLMLTLFVEADGTARLTLTCGNGKKDVTIWIDGAGLEVIKLAIAKLDGLMQDRGVVASEFLLEAMR